LLFSLSIVLFGWCAHNPAVQKDDKQQNDKQQNDKQHFRGRLLLSMFCL
jgi:hypothetical protein